MPALFNFPPTPRASEFPGAVFTLTDGTPPVPVSLVGARADLWVRRGLLLRPVWKLSSVGGSLTIAANTITLPPRRGRDTDLPPGDYRYDLVVTLPSGAKVQVVAGIIPIIHASTN